jgi:hypothetical protein
VPAPDERTSDKVDSKAYDTIRSRLISGADFETTVSVCVNYVFTNALPAAVPHDVKSSNSVLRVVQHVVEGTLCSVFVNPLSRPCQATTEVLTQETEPEHEKGYNPDVNKLMDEPLKAVILSLADATYRYLPPHLKDGANPVSFSGKGPETQAIVSRAPRGDLTQFLVALWSLYEAERVAFRANNNWQEKHDPTDVISWAQFLSAQVVKTTAQLFYIDPTATPPPLPQSTAVPMAPKMRTWHKKPIEPWDDRTPRPDPNPFTNDKKSEHVEELQKTMLKLSGADEMFDDDCITSFSRFFNGGYLPMMARHNLHREFAFDSRLPMNLKIALATSQHVTAYKPYNSQSVGTYVYPTLISARFWDKRMRYWLFPLNIALVHWILVVFDLDLGEAIEIDSFGPRTDKHALQLWEALKPFIEALYFGMPDKKIEAFVKDRTGQQYDANYMFMSILHQTYRRTGGRAHIPDEEELKLVRDRLTRRMRMAPFSGPAEKYYQSDAVTCGPYVAEFMATWFLDMDLSKTPSWDKFKETLDARLQRISRGRSESINACVRLDLIEMITPNPGSSEEPMDLTRVTADNDPIDIDTPEGSDADADADSSSSSGAASASLLHTSPSLAERRGRRNAGPSRRIGNSEFEWYQPLK